LRSDAYIKFFEHLDQEGGFFYERWGDAPVHSIAAALMLKKDEIHFFDEIAYWHVPFTHCPTDDKKRHELRCTCKPSENFDWKDYSCEFSETDLTSFSQKLLMWVGGISKAPLASSISIRWRNHPVMRRRPAD
jgi:alpha 1,2-mannosyltransferase